MASVDSTHGALFVASATHDLRSWQFAPARLNGNPVALTLPVEIEYAFPPGHDSAARLPLHSVRITDWVRAARGMEAGRADRQRCVVARRQHRGRGRIAGGTVLAWEGRSRLITGADSASVVVRRLIRWTPAITAVEGTSHLRKRDPLLYGIRSAGRWRVMCDRHFVVMSAS